MTDVAQTPNPPAKMSAEDAYRALMAPPTPAIDPNVPADAPAPDAATVAPLDAPSGRVSFEQLTDAHDAAQTGAQDRPAGNPADADPQKVLPTPNTEPAPNTPKRLTVADLAGYEVELNIDGRPVVVTGDKLIRDRQREVSANKRFEEASRLRAEAEAAMEAMSAALDDPDRLVAELRRSGRDPSAIARALFEREQQIAAMTPEQKRIAELEMREREFQAIEAQRQQKAIEYQTQQASAVYTRDFNAVLDAEQVAHPGLRKVLTAMMADATIAAEQQEERRLTKGEARALVRSVVGEYERPAAPETTEQRRARITADDVKWFLDQQKATKIESAPQLARDPRDVIGQPRTPRGQYASQRQPSTDINGRTVVQNVSSAWGKRF